jgi:hypothetical protein
MGPALVLREAAMKQHKQSKLRASDRVLAHGSAVTDGDRLMGRRF